jgi:anti-anti-sigma regulatory factor/anti-sigma regulatory factor (Ser/Thr protein kinase)
VGNLPNEVATVADKRTGGRASSGAAGAESQAAAPIRCDLDPSSPVATVHISGRLDVATAAQVRGALHKILSGHPTAIVVDLSGLAVDDDIALTALSAFARAAAEWPGCRVLICAPAPDVRADLHRLAVHRVAPVYDNRTAALAAAQTVPPAHRYRTQLPPAPGSVTVARSVVAEACGAWRLERLVDDAELVVTELVSNAVRHAYGDIELVVTVTDLFLHVSVRDGSPTVPRRGLPDPETGEGGRGLLLLDAVASGWGSRPLPPGKIVWATLRARL